MSNIQMIKAAWAESMERVHQNPWFKKLAAGDLTITQYKSYLRETFFHAGENPQIQAYTTVYLGREMRNINKMFYQHAISEVGHDELALNDLVVLGDSATAIRCMKPLPATKALIAYGYYCVSHIGPLAYLGYLFHLEFMPTTSGDKYIQQLKALGVPPEALTFLHEHATVDVHHNKMMEKYVTALVKSDTDLEVVIESAKTTCELHTQMVFSAFENAEVRGGQTFNVRKSS